MSTDTPLVLRGRLVTPRGVLDDGVVVVDGAVIVWVGPADGLPRGWALPEPSGTTILPGLVDLHCHGGGGASFPDAVDAADAQRAVDEHRRHGTTSLVASLVTAPPAVLLERTAVLATLADAGEIVGIHWRARSCRWAGAVPRTLRTCSTATRSWSAASPTRPAGTSPR